MSIFAFARIVGAFFVSAGRRMNLGPEGPGALTPHPTIHHTTMPYCHYAILSLCHTVTMPYCHYATMSLCHNVTMPQCHYAILSLLTLSIIIIDSKQYLLSIMIIDSVLYFAIYNHYKLYYFNILLT